MNDRPYQHYSNLDNRDKEFFQRVVWIELMDHVVDNREEDRYPTNLLDKIDIELEYHLELENYEAAQLLKDILERFETEIIDFG